MTDSECETRCCDYVKEYEEGGSCVEINDLTRCKDRKRNHRIALYIILGITAVIIFVCTYLKREEKHVKKERLEMLKNRKANEENVRATRAKTEAPQSRSTRLTPKVTTSLPNSSTTRNKTQVDLLGN